MVGNFDAGPDNGVDDTGGERGQEWWTKDDGDVDDDDDDMCLLSGNVALPQTADAEYGPTN